MIDLELVSVKPRLGIGKCCLIAMSMTSSIIFLGNIAGGTEVQQIFLLRLQSSSDLISILTSGNASVKFIHSLYDYMGFPLGVPVSSIMLVD